jgi:hypothetical protein
MCLLWCTNWVFISQKTAFFIVIAVKTSNLTRWSWMFEIISGIKTICSRWYEARWPRAHGSWSLLVLRIVTVSRRKFRVILEVWNVMLEFHAHVFATWFREEEFKPRVLLFGCWPPCELFTNHECDTTDWRFSRLQTSSGVHSQADRS